MKYYNKNQPVFIFQGKLKGKKDQYQCIYIITSDPEQAISIAKEQTKNQFENYIPMAYTWKDMNGNEQNELKKGFHLYPSFRMKV